MYKFANLLYSVGMFLCFKVGVQCMWVIVFYSKILGTFFDNLYGYAGISIIRRQIFISSKQSISKEFN